MKKIYAIIISCVLLVSFTNISFAETLEAEIDTSDLEGKNIEFNEENFPGMIITYTREGVPIVDDPNAIPDPYFRGVEAIVISPYGLFYSAKDLKEENLLFSIPRGKKVEVLDNNVSATVAQIKYAGYTGYIRKSNLKY